MNQISLERARKLRTNSTDAELRLWQYLRANRLNGHKFKRQQPLGSYIVDFVCFEARLIIEADGAQHADQQDYDKARDYWLKNQGFHVLRFWNNDVLENTEGVLQMIVAHLLPSPQPSPVKGEGA